MSISICTTMFCGMEMDEIPFLHNHYKYQISNIKSIVKFDPLDSKSYALNGQMIKIYCE